MNNFFLLPLLLLLSYLALVAQELLPPLHIFGDARIQLLPMLFCLGGLLMSFPLMLALAFGCGILFDLMHLQMVGGVPELAFGISILFFLLIGTICQGVSPLFHQGKWWIGSILSAIATSSLIALQFLLLSLKRMEDGGLLWNTDVMWKILFPGLIAFLLAPALLLLLQMAGAVMRPEGSDHAYP